MYAASAQLSIAPYSSLPTASTCASIDVPEGANPGTTVEFKGSANTGSVNALAVDLNDVLSIFEVAQHELNVTISYNGYATIDTHNISVIDWSDDNDCSLLLQTVLSIQNSIIGANFSVASSPIRHDNVILTVDVFGETEAKITIELGDGLLSVPNCEVSGASLSVMNYNFTYENPGIFEMIVSAYNTVTNITKSHIINVYERIHNLAIFGNNTVLVPPGYGTWQISAGMNKNALDNIVCVWNMGTNYPNITFNVSLLNSAVPHQITFTYGQSDVGTQTIYANCSNPMSSQIVTMDINVVWDNVTLGELICNNSTLWNHSITCQLTIVRFGTGACFEWNMGDGKEAVYYRDTYCAADVPAALPTYVQV